MKPWQTILVLLCLVASFTAGYHIRGNGTDKSLSYIDTVIITDTIRDSIPNPTLETVVREATEPFHVYITLAGDTIHDTIYVPVPITVKEYKTDGYRLLISGYKPNLDYIEVYQRTEQVTRTIQQRRFGIGITAGYGVGRNGLSPYIGVGGFYRIW